MTPWRNNRHGFTVVELAAILMMVFVLVVLVPWPILAAREKARRTQCMNNLREVGMACQMYSRDNSDRLPCGTASVFSNLAFSAKYIASPKVLDCPSSRKIPAASFRDPTATDAANVSYSQSANSATGTVAQADPNDWEFWDQGVVGLRWAAPSNHKGAGGNVLFGDVHIAWQSQAPTNVTLGCLNP